MAYTDNDTVEPAPKKKGSKGDSKREEDKLTDLKELFSICSDAENDQREQMLDDLEFGRMSQQWPQEIANQRKQEGRPTLTINRLPAFIRQVVNDVRQNRPQIKIKPVDGSGDRATANVFAGLIRNIEVSSNSDIAYDTALDFAVSCGVGYFRVDIDYNSGYSFDKNLKIRRIPNVFSVYGDPLSKEASSADWNKAFLVDVMSKKEFELEFKGAEPVDWENSDYSNLSEPWLADESIMLAEAWVRDKVPTEIVKLSSGLIVEASAYENIKPYMDLMGVTVEASRTMESYRITQSLMSGAEILDETSWVGKYIPIVPVYGEEINIEGKKRYNSLIHSAKDAQRMFNYWRSTSTELLALAPKVPWIAEEGSFDVEGELQKWKNSNVKSYPFLQYKKGRPPPARQMLDSGPAAGALAEAGHANDDMKSIMGMYDASLGQRSNEVSGRAIMARQREGDVSTFHFVDNLSRSIQHTGCILVDLIPKVYTGQRIVRIIDQEGNQQKVQIGTGLGGSPAAMPPGPPPPQGGMAGPGAPPPSLMGGPAAPGPPSGPPGMPPVASPPAGMPGMPPPQMGAEGPPGMPPGGPAMPPPPPPQPPGPTHEDIMGVFDLSAGEYDVVVDTGPSVTTRREEIAMQMTEFAKVYPQILPAIGDLMVKALDWPNADLIADRLTKMQSEGARQSQMEKDLQRLQAENMVLKAGLQIDQQSLKIDQFNADTKRIAATKEEAPESGPDPIDQFNAQTKRMQAESQAQVANEDAKLKRVKTATEGYKTVMDVLHPPQPKPTNGGSH